MIVAKPCFLFLDCTFVWIEFLFYNCIRQPMTHWIILFNERTLSSAESRNLVWKRPRFTSGILNHAGKFLAKPARHIECEYWGRWAKGFPEKHSLFMLPDQYNSTCLIALQKESFVFTKPCYSFSI